MQTFLPYPQFVKSASVLDSKRLGKQRVECLQILNTLLGFSTGWRHHPAVKMWAGHEGSLQKYGIVICEEWVRRGYKDTCLEKIRNLPCPNKNEPVWLGYEPFHESHRSNLLRKDYVYYCNFNVDTRWYLPYVWPSNNLHLIAQFS